MTDTWWQRLKEAMDRKGMSAPDLAAQSGVKLQNLYKYLQGAIAKPRGNVIDDLAATLDVDPVWLERGVSIAKGVADGAFTPVRNIPLVPLKRLSALKSAQDLQALARGLPVIPVPAKVGGNAFALELPDDSMGERFPRGCVIVCDPDAPLVPGRYVVAVDLKMGDALFRRYRPLSSDGARYELIAEHPDYPTVRVTTKKEAFIIGRAVMKIDDL